MIKNTLFSICIIASSFSFSYAGDLAQNCEDYVGEVKISALSPEAFRSRNGKCWVLMDGKNYSKCKEYTEIPLFVEIDAFKTGKIPDARGMFLRGMNHNGEGADPDKKRKVGSTQLDSFKKHEHLYTDFFMNKGKKRSCGTCNNRFDAAVYDDMTKPRQADTQDHNNEGGDETRPKNISFYMYINLGKKI